jgi:hypothetical protein
MQFVNAVKFQAGWYHGLYRNYRARPDICSGRVFLFVYGQWDKEVGVKVIQRLKCYVTIEALLVNSITKGVHEHDEQQSASSNIVSNH